MLIEKQLNGKWKLLLDKEDKGISEKWFESDKIEKEGITVDVPAPWERWFPSYDGVGWYSRSFVIQKRSDITIYRLRFDAVNYKADVWLNSKYLGMHEGGYTPFEFDITSVINLSNRNIIVVRVLDVGKERIDDLVLDETPKSKEHFQGNLGGIWQNVKLIGTGNAFIRWCHITPDIHNKRIKIFYNIQSTYQAKGSLCITVRTKKTAKRVTNYSKNINLLAGENSINLTIPLKKFTLWSCQTPFLYELDNRLYSGGKLVDINLEHFGMRHFTVKNNRFYLNDKEIFIKGLLHQGGYPLNLHYPENIRVARKELLQLKSVGCNMFRLHIKTWHPITLELADEIGVLIYEEPSIGWMESEKRLTEHCEREIREMIVRDYNHPSIVIWGILNETGAKAQKIREHLCHYARSLDSSRLIIDDSGSFEFTGSSNIMLPFEDKLTPTEDRHGYYRSPLSASDYEKIKKLGNTKWLLFRSEYGTGGLPDLPKVYAEFTKRSPTIKPTILDEYEQKGYLECIKAGFTKYGLYSIFKDESDFCIKSQQIQADAVFYETQAMRLNPAIAGYVITQYADYSHETGAGLVDIWRKPKKAFYAMKKQCQPLIITLMPEPLCTYAGRPIKYELATVNEDETIKNASIVVELVNQSNNIICSETLRCVIPRGIQNFQTPIFIPERSGKVKLRAKIIVGNKIKAHTEETLLIFNQPEWKELTSFAVIDPKGKLSEFLKNCGLNAEIFTPESNVSCILIADIDELEPTLYEKIIAAYSHGHAGSLVAFLGLCNTKPMSPWRKGLFLDFYPDFFPEKIQLVCAEGRVENTFHWVQKHPLFDGLPSNCLLNKEYRNIYPKNCIVNENPGREILAGCYHMSPRMWGVDIMLISEGKGKIMFNQFDITSHLGNDAAADIMLYNIIKYAHSCFSLDKSLIDLSSYTEKITEFRKFVETSAREWLILGPFENKSDNEGINRATKVEFYPIDPLATYEGAVGNIEWQKVIATKQNNYYLDLGVVSRRENSFIYCLTYFKSTVHKRADLSIIGRNYKIWFNNLLIGTVCSGREMHEKRFDIDIRRGWNKILIKSADECYDGTFYNTINSQIYDKEGNVFKDLVFCVSNIQEAETEIAEGTKIFA